jgi:four helix bundle protein
VEEEADESIFWLELIVKSNMINAEKIKPLMDEANELLAIFVASLKTMKAKTTTSDERRTEYCY